LFQPDLPAGKLVEFLVGFTNRGSQDMVVEALEASFRYPVDFSFHIQNFSQLLYSRTVKPTHQATLFYSFIPAETFAGRPFGLSVNLHYRDAVSEVLYSNFLVICLFFIAVLFLLGWHSLP